MFFDKTRKKYARNITEIRHLPLNRWTLSEQNKVQRIVQCEVPSFAGFCVAG